eukprot:scaffold292018_cov32-Tisochrysis_lutea.AAC.1
MFCAYSMYCISSVFDGRPSSGAKSYKSFIDSIASRRGSSSRSSNSTILALAAEKMRGSPSLTAGRDMIRSSSVRETAFGSALSASSFALSATASGNGSSSSLGTWKACQSARSCAQLLRALAHGPGTSRLSLSASDTGSPSRSAAPLCACRCGAEPWESGERVAASFSLSSVGRALSSRSPSAARRGGRARMSGRGASLTAPAPAQSESSSTSRGRRAAISRGRAEGPARRNSPSPPPFFLLSPPPV